VGKIFIVVNMWHTLIIFDLSICVGTVVYFAVFLKIINNIQLVNIGGNIKYAYFSSIFMFALTVEINNCKSSATEISSQSGLFSQFISSIKFLLLLIKEVLSINRYSYKLELKVKLTCFVQKLKLKFHLFEFVHLQIISNRIFY